MEIIVLKKKDIENIFTMKEAILASKDALVIYSKGESDIPLRVSIDIPEEEGTGLYMPGFVEKSEALGVKIVSTFPNNHEKGLDMVLSTMVLQDTKTGQVCSIIDGNYLTQLRTGAVSGAATDLLARKDASIFALIGTGGQAKSQLEAVLNVRNIQEVRVYGRNKDKAQKFVDRMKIELGQEFDFKIFATDSPKKAVENADIITCVTTAKNPVFDGKHIKKGAHINGVGSYTPEMQELDPYILINADKIYTDTNHGVLNESGDFIIPMRENKFSQSHITGELGDLVMGKILSRENDNEITIFKTVGSGVLDVVTAKRIYDKAVAGGIGEKIRF